MTPYRQVKLDEALCKEKKVITYFIIYFYSRGLLGGFISYKSLSFVLLLVLEGY